jgi:hydrogenase nickel incorporation protein HypA/HybF
MRAGGVWKGRGVSPQAIYSGTCYVSAGGLWLAPGPSRGRRQSPKAAETMHELSIAQTIIEVAEEKARDAGISRITAIKVRIGGLTTIVPESLDFCFGFAKEETLASGADLLIEEVKAEGRCNACRAVFPVADGFFLVCPACGSSDTQLLKGRELDLLSIEGEA